MGRRIPSIALRRARPQHGFTLIELSIVVTIIAILAAIVVPQYRAALRTARIVKATQDLRTISQAVDSFLAVNNRLPLTLYEVGFGGRLDPWGVPYCYLNYQAGTGDGLDWAVSVGLVDPSAVVSNATAARRPAAAVDGVLIIPQGQGSRNATTAGRGSGGNGNANGIGRVVSVLAGEISGRELAQLVHSLKDRSMFARVPVDTVRRRDQYLFPLNTDYDLFSLGPNGQTAAALNHPMSTDDVIRANNGGFYGVASNY